MSQRGWELVLQLPYPTTTSAGQALEGLERVEVYQLVRPVPESDRDLLGPDLSRRGAAPPAPPARRRGPHRPGRAARAGAGTLAAEVGVEAGDEVDE